MRILCIFSVLILSMWAQDIVLTPKGKYTIISNVHLINDISYKKEGFYQALVEIPAGTTAKWEVDHLNGNIEWEFVKGKPRNVQYLGYSGNYGFIPQTVFKKEDGGDGDPLDVIILGSAAKRGSVQSLRILGLLKLLDQREQDDKIIATPLNGPFSAVQNLEDMMKKFPGSIQIIRYWFEGYKGSKIHFMGYENRKRAEALLEKAHHAWSEQHNVLQN